MQLRAGVLIGLTFLSACAGQTGQVTSTSTVDTLATSSLPAVTGPLQAVIPDQPLLAQGSVEGADYLFVSAAVSVDEAVHAYIIGFRENEASVMAMSWSEGGEIRQSDPGVDGLDLDLNHPGPMPTSVTQQRDGTWVMHGFGVPTTPGATPIFWRALAESPTGPWRDPAIVYEVGGPEAWDGAWIDFPNVIVVEEGLSMLYEGASDAEPNSSHLGVATSPDGITWERPASPAVSPSDCEDVISIRMPRLLAIEEDWLLAFSAITEADEEAPIRLAAGQDPIHPSCAGAEVALTEDDIPSSGGIHSHALVRTASGPALLVESLDEEATGSSVWLVPLVG
jgi:hypothetical protein